MKDIRDRFNIKKNKKNDTSMFTIWEVLAISVSLVVFASVLTGILVNRVTEKKILEDEHLSNIKETYQTIVKEYYKDVDKEKLADVAIDAMMEYLNENYSVHMTEEEAEALQDKLQSGYRGIGVEITKLDGKVIITRVFENTPAEAAGLKAGDIIIKVDDFVVKADTELDEVTSTIKEKSKTTITVTREDETLEFKLNIESVEITVATIKTFTNNDKNIGYLYLESFSDKSADQVENKLKELEKNNIDALIFDVRSNTGGYLNAAEEIASLFLKKGKVIYSLEDKEAKKEVLDTTKESRDYPIVVLIDGATASASEILAAALKESYGATLIGTQTYGKGKVQQTNKLSDDTIIKYTTAKWYTPNGDSIDGVGLTPGIKVLLDSSYVEDPSDENDTQLQKAIEFLTGLE